MDLQRHDFETEVVSVDLGEGHGIVRLRAVRYGPTSGDVVDLEEVFSFEAISRAIEGMSKSLASSFSKAKPQKATVEFGVQVTIDAGKLTAMFVDGSVDTNLNIKLEWEFPRA